MRKYFLKYNEFLNESLSTSRKTFVFSNEYLNESLSSARTKYVDTKLMASHEFDMLSRIDPTSTKKYLEKMCDWYVNDHDPVREIESYIKKFHTLLPKLEQKDINKYGKFEEFKEMLDGVESKTAIKKVITKGVEVVFENDDVQITQPKTYEESCILGAGTKWCTASKDTPSHWNDYTENKLITFYYMWFKNVTPSYAMYKIAVGIDHEGEIRYLYNALDNVVDMADFEAIVEETNIPMDIFKSNISSDKDDIIEKFEEALNSNNFDKINGMVNGPFRNTIQEECETEILQFFENLVEEEDAEYVDNTFAIFGNYLNVIVFNNDIIGYLEDNPEFFNLCEKYPYLYDRVKEYITFEDKQGIYNRLLRLGSSVLFRHFLEENEEYRTMENFEIYLSMNPNIKSVGFFIRNTPEFHKQEYFDRYLECAPKLYDAMWIIRDVLPLKTKENIKTLCGMSKDVEDYYALINNLNINSVYIFKKFIDSNPNRGQLSASLFNNKYFERWYDKLQ